MTKPMRWCALVSGVAGIAANTFLVLFYVVGRPWQEDPPATWFGRANDSLVVVQYLALVPVVLGLGRVLAGDGRARVWTRVGLISCGLLVVLQLLLLTRVLPFGIQVGPAALCVVASIAWAAGIGAAGRRAGVLPAGLARTGRVLALAVVAGAGLFVVVFVVALLVDVPGLWVLGALPGAAFFYFFPVWVLALAAVTVKPADSLAVSAP